jgi:precorrin-3B methylase
MSLAGLIVGEEESDDEIIAAGTYAIAVVFEHVEADAAAQHVGMLDVAHQRHARRLMRVRIGELNDITPHDITTTIIITSARTRTHQH